ncbi:MAG TPA: hypothetical protein VMI30_07650 [Stellaceae bacterium]|nr:hypothetical protein [Stellaceae bacterium]
MNYSRPELGERLAADYVLGQMPPLARRRFERAMAGSATIAAVVAAWSDRFAALDETTPAETPPARVWRAIDQQIGPGVRPPVRERWFLWRGFAALAVAASLALVVYIALNPMKPRQLLAAVEAKSGLAAIMETAKHSPADLGLSTMRLGVSERERPRWLRAALLITNQTVPLTEEDSPPAR